MPDMDNAVTCTSFASSSLSFSGWMRRALETAAQVTSQSERAFILTPIPVLVGELSAFCLSLYGYGVLWRVSCRLTQSSSCSDSHHTSYNTVHTDTMKLN